MSGPETGRYIITLATPSAPPPLPIGADYISDAIRPIIAGGPNRVWTVSKAESGNYTLTLQQEEPLYSTVDGSNLFLDTVPIPTEWVIRPQANGTYSIEVPTQDPFLPKSAWILTNPNFRSQVTLASYEFTPYPKQLWQFTLL